MKKMSSLKIIIYGILLLGAGGFFIYTKIQASYPFGEKELQDHALLATIPNTCETCDQILYYRNPENNNCNIKKVISHLEGEKEILSISPMTLQQWIDEKGTQKYIMPYQTHHLFSSQCFDFQQKKIIQK